jgi:hypothetical protein
MSSINNQFRINLPEGWDDQTAYTFMGPEVNGVQHLLTLVIDKNIGDTDLYNFALDRIDPVRSSLQGIETLKEEERTLPSGVPVYEWIYKWIPTEGNVIFKKQVYMLIGKRGYSFSASFSKQSFKTIGVEVDQMINSFIPGLESGA